MPRVGLLGAGHLGKIHAKLLASIPTIEFVGIYDLDEKTSKEIGELHGVKAFDSAENLFSSVDALDIVTPTLSHFEYGKKAILQGKHVFVEKPLVNTMDEADELLALAQRYPDLIFQVGHVERFNPAFLSVSNMELQPMFIEGHRLAMYNPRGTDVSVVLDLMIHDLDIVMSMVDSDVRQVSASGVAVVSDTPDIANARIEFENGCVANLTASRISIKNMRRLRMFQKNTYLAVDFLEKRSEILKISEGDTPPESPMKYEINTGDIKKYLSFELPEVKEVNAIKMELEEFASSIDHGTKVRVPIRDGYRALKVAHQILGNIDALRERILG